MPEAKPIVYAAIPEFNQETECVRQLPPVDKGSYIFLGVRVDAVEIRENSEDETEVYTSKREGS